MRISDRRAALSPAESTRPGAPGGGGGAFWDERYASQDFAFGVQPNRFLVEATAGLLRPDLRALVPGDGEGRNGVWLAEQGLDVTTVDLSAKGVAKARALAAERGVGDRLTALQADLAGWEWPTQAFDLVASIFLHLPPPIRAPVHAGMAGALRSGGHLVIEAFTPRQLLWQRSERSGGPRDEALLYTADLLAADFAGAGLTVVRLREEDVTLAEGAFHDGRGAVVRGVFRRGRE